MTALPPLPAPKIAYGYAWKVPIAKYDYYTAEQVEAIRRETAALVLAQAMEPAGSGAGHSTARYGEPSTPPSSEVGRKLLPTAPLLAHAADLDRCAVACDEEDMPATAAEFRKAAGEIRALVTGAPSRRSADTARHGSDDPESSRGTEK